MPAPITISKITYTSYPDLPGIVVEEEGSLTILKNAGVFASGSGASYGVAAANHTTIDVYGVINSNSSSGIHSTGGYNKIYFAASASVYGGLYAVDLSGDKNYVTNAGDINAGSKFSGGDNVFTNSGAVRTDDFAGISFGSGSGNVVKNYGSIDAVSFGVYSEYSTLLTVINSGSMTSTYGVYSIAATKIINSGAITGNNQSGVNTFAGVDTVINNGLIEGANGVAVNLGEGADVYDGRHGTLSGSVRGGAGGDRLCGGAGADTLDGGADNDFIDGGGGADMMIGGIGADTYTVDNIGDIVDETYGNEGETDTVLSSVVSIDLSDFTHFLYEVENVTLTGTKALNAYGNELNNVLRGNDAGNTLNGYAGADVMVGGKGNDTYYVDNVGDRIVEAADGGNDLVLTDSSFTLAAGQQIERFSTRTETLTIALAMRGNEFANTIRGNAGSNIIDGGRGNDLLFGLGGNDAFVFSTALPANSDRIVDFSVADDSMRLSRSVFTGLAAGALNAAAFKDIGNAGATVDSTDRVIYNHNDGALFFDADGSGGATAFQFATLMNHALVTQADFVVVA